MFTSTLRYHPDGKEQKTRDRALALRIGRTGLLACTVEDKDYIKMMEVVDESFIIPPKTKINNLIESIYKDEKEKYKEGLASARKITIGLDIWTTKGLNASFLAISASYFCTVLNKPQIGLIVRPLCYTHVPFSCLSTFTVFYTVLYGLFLKKVLVNCENGFYKVK